MIGRRILLGLALLMAYMGMFGFVCGMLTLVSLPLFISGAMPSWGGWAIVIGGAVGAAALLAFGYRLAKRNGVDPFRPM